MLRGEEQVELAMLRMELRSVEAEITKIREESKRYRQMRFGLDIKEIQLTALQEQRTTCRARIGELRDRVHDQGPRRNAWGWLLLPLALLHLLQRPPARAMQRYTPREMPVQGRELTAVGAGR